MTDIVQNRSSRDDAFTYHYNGNVNKTITYGPVSVEVFHKTSVRSPITRTSKSASGWRSPTPYHRTEESWTPVAPGVTSSHTVGYPSKDTYINGSHYVYNIGKYSMRIADSSMESTAIIKALAKLKNQDINLSTTFGERKEAADMMVNTVSGIARSVKRFRSTSPKQWLKVLRYETGHGDWHKIPGEWLELQYGWKPLMSDLHGACQTLNNRERDDDAYRATVKATVREVGRFQKTADCSPYNRQKIFFKEEVGLAVRLDYVLRNPILASLAQLGITNPLELTWELLPYSFVIDWFVPVGNYLSSLDAAIGWDFLGGSCTRWTRQSGTGIAAGYLYDSYYQGDGGNASYKANQFYMMRSIYDTSPLPRFPGLKDPFPKNGTHIANAMALLVSAFR